MEDIKDPQKVLISNNKVNNKIRWGREEKVNDKVVKVPALNYALPNGNGWKQRTPRKAIYTDKTNENAYNKFQRHNGLYAVKYYLKDNPNNFIVLSRETDYPYPGRYSGYNTFLNNAFVDDKDFFNKFQEGKYLMEIAKKDGGLYKNIKRQMKKDGIDNLAKEDVNYFDY